MKQTDSSKTGEGREEWLKEGGGISQRTYIHDSWTWTPWFGD